MKKYRVFVSSVQKEMELERLAISSLITTDPFLNEHLDFLFDKEPIYRLSSDFLKISSDGMGPNQDAGRQVR